MLPRPAGRRPPADHHVEFRRDLEFQPGGTARACRVRAVQLLAQDALEPLLLRQLKELAPFLHHVVRVAEGITRFELLPE